MPEIRENVTPYHYGTKKLSLIQKNSENLKD
jgi:hypothetical protein